MNSHLRDILIGSLTNEIVEVNWHGPLTRNLLAYTTSEQRPMSGPSDHGGFASNDRSNTTRNPAANVQIRSTAGSVCNWTSWRENQLINLGSVCDPSLGLGASNRKYHEPSAPRKITFYWTRLEKERFLLVRVSLLSFQSQLNCSGGLCLGAAVNAVTPVVGVGT